MEYGRRGEREIRAFTKRDEAWVRAGLKGAGGAGSSSRAWSVVGCVLIVFLI